jgi:asparagine synthase (glutamine-hydrolysing)
MCGIAGQLSTAPGADSAWVDAGIAALHHRGPDDGRVWRSADGRVAFGHRRLAIMDLSPAGAQPMVRGSLCLAFNGEIYNFVELRRELEARGAAFTSHSDTEVVLAAYQAWGVTGLERLDGMFALALHDATQQVVHLMRDRAGEKPLFYRQQGGTLRFASELKGLLADPALPRRLDAEALDCYLGMGFVPGGRCILQGYAKLPPAHRLRFDLASGQAELQRYWQAPALASDAKADLGTLAKELEMLLADAVRKQLVADVPVGVMLSGGVDSSLVTALASRARQGLRTFTVSFPGAGRLDESAHARLIARHFGTEHTEIVAETASVDLLPPLARQYDEPVIDSSMVPTFLVSQQIRRHCTVALGGDGGDELFGGYSHYDRLLKLQRRAALLPLLLRRGVRAATTRAVPPGVKGRNWLQALGADFNREVPLVASYFDIRQRQRLLNAEMVTRDIAGFEVTRATPTEGDLLQRATRLDFATYLPEDILVKVDRASMLHSLEVRAPMLDRRVLEFAFGRVPSAIKAVPGGRKLLLKELARRLLPPEFDRQRKQGFSIPIASWLDGGAWRNFFRTTLLDAPDGIFDRRQVEALFAGQARGRDNGERLFGLVMFELWRREYRIQS